jgi:hypothetical protein
MVATVPRWTRLTKSGLVLAALALGLGLAFAFHATVDGASGTSVPSGANVRGSLAHALANREGSIGDAPVRGGAASIEPPSRALSTPGEAVGTFLALEVAQDFDGSYGVLSEPDRSSATSRAAWAAEHAALPAVTGYEITSVQQHDGRADVSVQLHLRPQLSVAAGLVPDRATASFATIAEDGGWRVAFGETTLVPHYAAEARAPSAVRDWARARQRCRNAPEYDGGLTGAPARAEALCGARGLVRTGGIRTLPETAQDQPFLAAFGTTVHDWARVVRLDAPVRMDVVVAPVGERWLVVGVLPALSEPS